MSINIIGVTGWKNSGKTTLTERLVTELTRRGRRVSTVKHAHHEFDLDQQGKDSYRHRAAGAEEVAVVSSRRWAIMHELRDGPEPSLSEILAKLSPCDLVIVEGFKRDNHSKIEVRRSDARDRTPLDVISHRIVAIASDHHVEGGDLPSFDLNDVGGIANFIEKFLHLK